MVHHEVIGRIQGVLDQLRPAIELHGGNIEFVSFNEGTVSVKLHGACVGCPASFFTLQYGVEKSLKEQIPEVTRVVTTE